MVGVECSYVRSAARKRQFRYEARRALEQQNHELERTLQALRAQLEKQEGQSSLKTPSGSGSRPWELPSPGVSIGHLDVAPREDPFTPRDLPDRNELILALDVFFECTSSL